jgi:hypothetical protein
MSVRLMMTPVAPYDFRVLADQLESTLLGGNFAVGGLYDIYDEYDVGTENLEILLGEVSEFSSKVSALQSALELVSASEAHEVNLRLMRIVETLDTALIAIGVWEQDWFPYQQPINDVYKADAAIGMLKSATGNAMVTGAIRHLNWVGMVWYYDYSSYDNYLDQRDRLTGSRMASWGLQTHLQLSVDVWPEYDALVGLMSAKTITPEALEPIIVSLEQKLVDVSIVQLEDAFVLMWGAIEDANDQIDALASEL